MVGSESEKRRGPLLWGMLSTREAMTREVISLLIVTTALALVLDLLMTDAPRWLFVFGFAPFLGCYITSYVLVHRGRARAAALLATGGTLLAQVGIGMYVQGQEAQALVSFVNLVLIAGFVLGPWAAVLTCLSAVVSVFSYFYLAEQGRLPPPQIATGPVAGTIALVCTIITTGGLVTIAIRHVRAALILERDASERTNQALAAVEKVGRDLFQMVSLSEALVDLGAQMIEVGSPQQLARRLCDAVEEELDVTGVWVVGRSGAILGASQGVRASKCEAFPVTLDGLGDVAALSTDDLASVAQWASLEDLSESGIFAVPGASDVSLVVVGGEKSCVTDASVSFLTAAAGMLASGLARTRAEAQLRQAQRMDAVGRLSAGLSHDFNNLLMAIMAGSELVRLRLERGQDVRDQLAAIESATARAAGLTQRLMAFTASEAQVPGIVDLTAAVGGVMVMLDQTLESRIALEVSLPPSPLWIRADPIEVERAVMNLVVNAKDAIVGSGRIRVALSSGSAELPDREGAHPVATLTVEDDGEGMSAEVERRIFEPFFTTRAGEGGHGLGLSAVYALSKGAAGQVEVRSRPGEGARFDIIMPLVDAPALETIITSSTARAPSPEVSRILIVDDSSEVRSLLTEVMAAAGYEVVVATHGREALAKLTEGHQVDIVVSDVVMPEMGGVKLAQELRKRWPELPIILMSGYSAHEDTIEGVQRLQKPFAMDELIDVIALTMQRAAARSERQRKQA